MAPQEFWDRARSAVGDRVVVTWSSTSALLEMSAQGVTKATTLAALCADLGVDTAEVLAVGDMPNDIDMLAWAGTSYAMANAHETVLEVADHVAATQRRRRRRPADRGAARRLRSPGPSTMGC